MTLDLVALSLSIIGALSATIVFLLGIILLIRSWGLIVQNISHLERFFRAPHLVRSRQNPILFGTHMFEARGAFNPTAVVDQGRVHLFYRAVSADGVSRIGYASSADGSTIDERAINPVFELRVARDPLKETFMKRYYEYTQPGLVASGGSFAGVEDPRAVIISDRLYISFSAFYSWDSLRIGVTSLSLADLRQRKWHFTPPIFISPLHQVHKNWVLFPEKINGAYTLFHGLAHDNRNRALVDTLPTLLETPHSFIESDARFRSVSDTSSWDLHIRGAGPSPIKTEHGWLLFYHATDAIEPHKYKLGAMLLDLENPSRVLMRSTTPILTPDASYENNGAKAGVIYACGAVVKDGTLFMYYGGSDSVVCVATAPFDAFLKSMLSPVNATL